MICSSCQTVLSEEALFCSKCGIATAKIQHKTTVHEQVPDTDPNAKTRKLENQKDPRIGLVLDSKYQLIERIGQGGMGTVYRARRLHIGDEVAVKLLGQELLRDEYALERFRREARSAAMIQHPNVVSIHDFSDGSAGSAANEAYIVMEFVRGESLKKLLEREGHISPTRAVALMQDICAGVGIAHRQKLLHRDLKPDNVIVAPAKHDSDHETAKVVDFGLAKLRDENVSPLTQTGTLMGTILYMAPEQCRGEELDSRADVYSLGAIFYEMVSGSPPFLANNLTGLINKHLNETAAPFSESLEIPAALANACFRALAKDREERQADAIELGKELVAALNSPSATTAPQTVAKTFVAPNAPSLEVHSKSSPWKWIVGIGGVLLLGVVVVVIGAAIWFGSRQALVSKQDQTNNTNTINSNSDHPVITANDLRGNWKGPYGPLGQTATLNIKNQTGNTFEAVLEQGQVKVAVKGTIDSNNVHMTQTKVLSGGDWNLGEDTGTLSSDGKRMSGTGKDPLGASLGITYEWAFSR